MSIDKKKLREEIYKMSIDKKIRRYLNEEREETYLSTNVSFTAFGKSDGEIDNNVKNLLRL